MRFLWAAKPKVDQVLHLFSCTSAPIAGAYLPQVPGSLPRVAVPAQPWAWDGSDVRVSPRKDTLWSPLHHLKPLKANRNLLIESDGALQ